MKPKVALSFQWTVDELREAHRQFYAHGFLKYYNLLFYPLFVIIFGLLIILFTADRPPSNVFIFVLSVVVLTLIVFIGLIYNPIIQFRRVLRESKAFLDKETAWEISDDDLNVKRSDGSGGQLKWEYIRKAVKGSKGFLLFLTTTMFHWLPYHAFRSEQDINLLTEICKRNAKNFREVR